MLPDENKVSDEYKLSDFLHHDSSFLLLPSLELSDTTVYAPQIRALLETASHDWWEAEERCVGKLF